MRGFFPIDLVCIRSRLLEAAENVDLDPACGTELERVLLIGTVIVGDSLGRLAGDEGIDAIEVLLLLVEIPRDCASVVDEFGQRPFSYGIAERLSPDDGMSDGERLALVVDHDHIRRLSRPENED